MKPKSEQTKWNEAQVLRCRRFTACLFLGVGKFDTREFGTLAEARQVGASMTDRYGRQALIYGITPEGWTIHVEDGYGLAD